MISKNKLQHIVLENKTNALQLSKKIGVSHTTISRLLNGERSDMKLSTAFKLADALDVDVNEFREEK